MLDELKVRDAARVPPSRRRSDPTSPLDAFDMASATKSQVEVALPSWHAMRQRLTRDRIRHRDTTHGDKLFVTLLRGAGISLVVGLAILAAIFAFSTAGPVGGLVAGVGGLAIGLAAVFGAVVLARSTLARKEDARQATVVRLDLAIRQLDERISRARFSSTVSSPTRGRGPRTEGRQEPMETPNLVSHLTIRTRRAGSVVILDVDGRLTTGETSVKLRDSIAAIVDSGSKKILANLVGVREIDDSGLGAIVSALGMAERHGATFKLVNMTVRLRELLGAAHLATVFETFDSERDALRSFAKERVSFGTA
jgi:anti-sigma B factor antagonist